GAQALPAAGRHRGRGPAAARPGVPRGERHAPLPGGDPMTRPVKDVAASVRQRLQNTARETSRLFQEVLGDYAMERFLYRLARSPHAGQFVLKGALLLRAWNAPASRPTKDIDLLGRMENSVAAVVPVFRNVCGQQVEPDGLTFHTETAAGV